MQRLFQTWVSPEKESWVSEKQESVGVYKVYIVLYFLNFESYEFTASSKIVKIKGLNSLHLYPTSFF